MSNYTGIQKEETLKGLVRDDYFPDFGYEPNIDNIDFVITDKKARADLFSANNPGSSIHYLWAESKKGVQDVESMLTQLMLTCKKTYEKGYYLAPPFIGCFDTEKIAFVPFYDILHIFCENDVNWKAVPHDHDAPDFQKLRGKIIKLILSHLVIFRFDTDANEIKTFIKNNFISDATGLIKIPITKDNFGQIFIKWIKEVQPSINISKDEWSRFRQKGILDCDFFRADMMSEDGNAITFTEKLKIILEKDNYKLQEIISDRLFQAHIDFIDNGEAYRRFWNKYTRPPADEYRGYIIERRDLLVPQNIRERKGSFFTPAIWVKKSHEYLANVFGDNWQEEYYVWDCAAGTGNLFVGLTNKYNVWASTIDQSDVDTIRTFIDIDDKLDLLDGHIFQFDFLNDSFDKLPEGLKEIINDPEERKKLIMYINPPYAEGDNRKGEGRKEVAVSKIHDEYQSYLKKASGELFALFLARIYFEIPDCYIAEFSTLKSLSAPNFSDFRAFFQAKLEKGFVIPADSFENVSGKFPIGFKIWNTKNKEVFTQSKLDVYDAQNVDRGVKSFFAYDNCLFISAMLNDVDTDEKTVDIAHMSSIGNDFQHQNALFIDNIERPRIAGGRHTIITNQTLINVCVYFAVRKVIPADWLNDRDQFLYPNDGWKTDIEFQNNCLVYTLFNNNIQSEYGVNHWIPFTEKQVDAKDKFKSHCMSDFIKDRTFSPEAQAVLAAGLELWKYYHLKTRNNKQAPVAASFYDIRAFFQGHDDAGRMKNKSTDEMYNTLIADLREKLKVLTLKIQPKVYEYGFLKE